MKYVNMIVFWFIQGDLEHCLQESTKVVKDLDVGALLVSRKTSTNYYPVGSVSFVPGVNLKYE